MNLLHLTNRAISSVGRASRLHREGRQFEPVIAHHSLNFMNLDDKGVSPLFVDSDIFAL